MNSLAAGFVFGVFGLYLLKWGRQRANTGQFLIGVILMVYPYLVENPYLLWGIGIAGLALAYQIN